MTNSKQTGIFVEGQQEQHEHVQVQSSRSACAHVAHLVPHASDRLEGGHGELHG